jgi:hypothetical protein
MMNRRINRFQAFLFCVALTVNAGCGTTPKYTPIGEDSIYGITKGDQVPVRWAASGESEMIRITSINEKGFAGVGDRGRRVAARYDETLEIGHRPDIDQPVTGTDRVVDKVLTTVAGTMFAAAGVAICAGAPVVCLQLLAEAGGDH